jgi:hypothetical protein
MREDYVRLTAEDVRWRNFLNPHQNIAVCQVDLNRGAMLNVLFAGKASNRTLLADNYHIRKSLMDLLNLKGSKRNTFVWWRLTLAKQADLCRGHFTKLSIILTQRRKEIANLYVEWNMRYLYAAG